MHQLPNASERIDHLEGSIANVQEVLSNAQKVLAVADETQRKADDIAKSASRILAVVAVAGAALMLLTVTRRLGR